MRKALLGGAVVIVALLVFMTWYRLHYSMGVARSFAVNDANLPARVLIATQGSDFKDSVVAGVVEHLKARPAYVKVIDVSGLRGVNEDEWGAIVILHTWQMGKPQADAKAFVDRARNIRKVVLLSTSGAGEFKIEGVDAIASASKLEDVPARVADITKRVDATLAATPDRKTTPDRVSAAARWP